MAKKTTAKRATKKKTSRDTVADFSTGVAELASLAEQMVTVMNAMGLQALTAEEREHSMGRMRSDEPAAITAVLNAMDKYPGLFASLADKDGGDDAAEIETAPARASLARAQELGPVVKTVGSILTRLSDDTLASGATVKGVSLPAYAIAKANAANNAKLSTTIAKAIDFYAGPARKNAMKNVRAANAAKKAAKNGAPKT